MEFLIGIIVILAVSWLLLWLIEKKNLSVLGFAPTRERWIKFVVGFIIMGILCSITILLITIFGHNSWKINDSYSFSRFLFSLRFTLGSVVGEELVFRGAVLYILIKRTGMIRGCILSAIAFGIYHWFTYEAFGNPVQMIFIFILTGMAGFMFAYCYAKTNSLYLPIGLHFGWNFTNIIVFSNGPLGKQLFVWTKADDLTTTHSLILLIFQAFIIPAIVLWYAGFFRKKVAPVPATNSNKRL